MDPSHHTAGSSVYEVPPQTRTSRSIFARGTFAPQGLGGTGAGFVNALRPNSAAGRWAFRPSVYDERRLSLRVDGIRDASSHIEDMAANCPNTKLVLAGYSQGAAVMGFVTANAVPCVVDPSDVPQPMPADVADHVAAFALLSKQDQQFMQATNSRPSPSARCTPPRPSSCAHPVTRYASTATTAPHTPATPRSSCSTRRLHMPLANLTHPATLGRSR